MLSAQEAYEKSLERINEQKTELLKDIEDKINEAILNGRFFIIYKNDICKEIRQVLQNCGYLVQPRYQYNETYCFISWDKKDNQSITR